MADLESIIAPDVAARFWAKVEKGASCWEWRGANVNGRGQISFNGKNWLAPRMSWLLHVGPIPEGQWVLHKCDNPACVNPEHLYIGDVRQNAADAIERGRVGWRTKPESVPRGVRHGRHTKPHRTPRGEGHGRAKLNERAVREIREAYASGATSAALAERYGVSLTTIHEVVARRAWKHVP